MTITKHGVAIRSLDEWFLHAPPKKPTQWQDGRSAKDAATAWLAVSSPKLPLEVESLLTSSNDFGPVESWYGEPEDRAVLRDRQRSHSADRQAGTRLRQEL